MCHVLCVEDTVAGRAAGPRWRPCGARAAGSCSAAESISERRLASGPPSDRTAPRLSEDSALQRRNRVLFLKMEPCDLSRLSCCGQCGNVLGSGLVLVVWIYSPDLLMESAGLSDSSNTVRCCRLASLKHTVQQVFNAFEQF